MYRPDSLASEVRLTTYQFLCRPVLSRANGETTRSGEGGAPQQGTATGASAFEPYECFVLGSRTYDDGYVSVRRGARFALSGGGRRIVLRFDSGYPCAQVYAPDDDDVICFEPMTAPTDALVSGDHLTWVPPGASYTATFSISVS